MKKLLFAAALVLLVVAGCTFLQKKEEIPAAPVEAQLEKKIGIVSTADDQGLLASPSKFALTSDTNEKIFIDALSINLKKYTKRRVEAEGKWNDTKTVFVVDSITSIGQETQVKESFMDTELGLKFQYPSIWLLKSEKNVLGLQRIVITPYEVSQEERSSVDTITIERSENNRKLSARDWLNLDDQYRSKDPLETNTTYQQSAVGVAQTDAVKKTVGTGEKVEFFVNRDVYIYRFTHSTVADADKDLYRNEFFNLINSFEFVPLVANPANEQTPATPQTDANKDANSTVKPTEKVTPTDPNKQVTEPLSQLAAEELAKRKLAEDALKAESDLTNSRQSFINYIKQNISTLAPEAPTAGSWTATQFEFVAPEGQSANFNAIYVTYSSGTEVRKILLSVSDRTNPSSATRVAYFKQGSVADWDLADGTDTGKTGEKTVFKEGSTAAEAVVVKKGMRLLESRSWKIKIQYPANYYWAFINGQYGFGNKPITSDNSTPTGTNATMTFSKDQALPPLDTSTIDIGGKSATEGVNGDVHVICIQAKARYCIQTTAELATTAKEMLATLQENQ